MKKLFTFFCLAWLAVSGNAATVQFNLSDFAANPLSIRTVRITPVQSSQGSGTTVITGDAISYSTDTNGTFTVTNIAAGSYKVEAIGGNIATTFYILAPTNQTTMSAAGLLTQPVATTGGQMAYAAKASDLRYPSVAGTNIVVYTNAAGRVVINSTGGGGSSDVTSATNDLSAALITLANNLVFTNAVASSNVFSYGATNLVLITPDMTQAQASNAFRFAPSGSRIVFRGSFTNFEPGFSGSYLSDSNAAVALFKLNSHTNTIVEGEAGAEFVFHGGAGNPFELRNCQNVLIRNISLRWITKPLTPNNDFSVVWNYHNCRNLLFDRIRIENFHNHGINEQIVPLRGSSNTVVRNSIFIRGGITNFNGSYPNTDGSAVQVDAYGRVEDCFFANMPRGIEIEGAAGNGHQVRNVIRGNVFSNVFEYGIFNITAAKGDAGIIKDNYLALFGDQPPSWVPIAIYQTAGRGMIIEGNTILNYTKGVSLVAGTAGMGAVQIRGNHFRTNSFGIDMSQSSGTITGVVITANFLENSTNGIIADGDAISITGNTIIDSGDGTSSVGAIALKKGSAPGSGSMLVADNLITDSRGLSAMYYGVQIYANVTNCIVANNLVRGHRFGATTNKGLDNIVVDRGDLERIFSYPFTLTTTNAGGTNHIARFNAVNGTLALTINTNGALEFRNATSPAAKTNIYIRMVSDQAYGYVGQDAYVVPNSGNAIIGSRIATYFRPGATTNGAQILELGTGISGSVIRPTVFLQNGRTGFLTNNPLGVVTAVADAVTAVPIIAYTFASATTNAFETRSSANAVQFAVNANGQVVVNTTNDVRIGLVGNGAPTISAGRGSDYRDLATGKVYFNTNGTTGWHPAF